MKASPEDQRLLLDLAALDATRVRLQTTAASLPEQQHLVRLEAERSARRAELVRLTGVVEDSEAELRRLRSDVDLVEGRMARDEQRMSASSSSKDLAGLEHELATLRRRRSDLEDIQLEVMERLDGERAELEIARSERDRVEAEAAELTQLRDAAILALRREAKENGAARAELAGRLPVALVELYEKRRSHGGVGAAQLVGGVTMASGVALDPADLTRIAAADPDDIIMCPDSGVILVRPEKPAAR